MVCVHRGVTELRQPTPLLLNTFDSQPPANLPLLFQRTRWSQKVGVMAAVAHRLGQPPAALMAQPGCCCCCCCHQMSVLLLQAAERGWRWSGLSWGQVRFVAASTAGWLWAVSCSARCCHQAPGMPAWTFHG